MVKDRLKQSGFVHSAVAGFSLLELIAGMALIAILMTVAIPAFKNQTPRAQREIFLENMNALTCEALIRALETGNPHRILCNLSARTLFLEEQMDEKTRDGELVFEKRAPRLGKVGEQIPEIYEFQQFFIEGIDEIAKYGSGKKADDVWFFVLPEGVAQEVIINALDMSKMRDGAWGVPFSLVLNTYQVQFELFDEFQTLPS